MRKSEWSKFNPRTVKLAEEVRSYLRVWPRPRHLLQRVAPQALDQLAEALALDLGQTLLLVHLQRVHLLLVAQLLLPGLGQALELRLLQGTAASTTNVLMSEA